MFEYLVVMKVESEYDDIGEEDIYNLCSSVLFINDVQVEPLGEITEEED